MSHNFSSPAEAPRGLLEETTMKILSVYTHTELVSLILSCMGLSVLYLVGLRNSCHAYSFSSRRPPSISFFGSGFGGNHGGEPPSPFNFFDDGDLDDDDGDCDNIMSSISMILLHASDSVDSTNEPHIHNLNKETVQKDSTIKPNARITLRGGGSQQKQNKRISLSVSKWLSFFKGADESECKSKSKQQKEILESTDVTDVTAPKSELLPAEVIALSAEHAKLIGGTLTPDTLDSTARSINNWYASQGYVMNSVTGATLVPNKGDNTQGRVELKVRETKLSNSKSKAVVIRFVEKCNDESAAGEDVINIPIQTYSQHSNSEDEIQEYQKYRITSGRTRPLKLARMVGLAPGSDFRINPERWSRIVAFPRELFGGGQTNNGSTGSKSAIFSTIHAVRPIPEEDGTVSIEIIATENKPFVSLEYGVTKSLYSDQWEGEFDLKHGNAFGGGEVAAINVKKGRNNLSKVDSSRDHSVLGGWNQLIKDGPLSWRMSVSDDHFGGSNSGYDLEIFRDFVGEAKESEQSATSVERTGATMRLRLPQRVLTRAVSASFEQIDNSNTAGAPMQSASLCINVGPVSFLRSGLSALLTAGVQRDDRAEDIKSGTEDRSFMQPYFRGTVTSQKILPLCKSILESEQSTRSSLDLALRHVVSMSTKHLPRHDAITLGFSSRVRGYKYSPGPISSKRKNWASFLQLNNAGGVQPPVAISNSISGNIELRLPFRPFFANKNRYFLTSLLEGKFVAFGDWAFTQEAESISDSKFNRFSSVGAGYRKNIQGLPLKLDAVLTEHGTGGLFFGIGRDFGG